MKRFVLFMNYKIATAEEWDAVIRDNPRSTFFQKRAWIELWEKMIPESESLCYIFEDNYANKIYWPGLKRNMFKGFVQRFDSSPEGTYGGFLSLIEPDSLALSGILKKVKFSMSYTIRQKIDPKILLYDGMSIVDTTQVINLSNWNIGNENYNQNIRRNIAKAIKNKVEIKESESVEDWKLYFGMYRQSLKRWKKNPETMYPFSFFEKLRDEKRLNTKLWLARIGDEYIYGCLVFYHNKTAYYWHGSGLQKSLEAGASSYLQHTIIQKLKEEGYLWYDLMPNGGKESLYQFKAGLHAIEQPVFGITHKTNKYILFEKVSKIKTKILGNEY